MINAMAIVTRFFPNGEFTKGVDTSNRRRTRLDHLQDKLLENRAPVPSREVCADIEIERISAQVWEGRQFSTAYALYTCLRRDYKTFYYAVEPYAEDLDLYVVDSPDPPHRFAYARGALDIATGAVAPLGSSDGRIFTEMPKPSRKKGLTMTRNMARNIRNAGYLLQQQYGKNNLSFLTLTLPDLDSEDLAKCSQNWGRMVDQFLKWLRSKIEVKADTFEYVYCTEVQTLRLTNRGEYALHLHLLFKGRKRNRSAWYITPKNARRAWIRCIEAVIGHRAFKSDALENLQQIRRSASGYLAKYMSKGCNSSDTQHVAGDIPRFKGHWGGMARSLGRLIKCHTVRIVGKDASWYFITRLLRNMARAISQRFVRYYAEGVVCSRSSGTDENPRGILVGVGCLTRPTYEGGLVELYQFIYSLEDEL
jgi:hypothetical protein